MSREPLHRGILAIDIEGFGRHDRTDPLRARLRERLYTLLNDALSAAEIPPETIELRGDGLLMLADPRVSVARLLHPFIARLATELSSQNRNGTDAERLRLRAVIHDGQVLADTHGYTGAALIHAFRLLDAEAVRAALRSVPAADLVVVVSDPLWESIVSQEYPGIDPTSFQPVWVHTKETRTRAWIHLVGWPGQPRLPETLVSRARSPEMPPAPIREAISRSLEGREPGSGRRLSNRGKAAVAGLIVTVFGSVAAATIGKGDEARRVAGCSRIPPTARRNTGDGTLSFGTLLPKTGSLNDVYQRLDDGVQLAIEDIRAAGGVLGMNLRFDQADQRDSGDASSDIACRSADALLAAGVDAIIGPASSAVGLKVIDKVVGAGVILFSPANAAPAFSTYDDRGLYFRTAPSNVLQGPVLGRLVVSDGNRSAAVISLDDIYGNSLREETARGIEKAGGRVVDSFNYDPHAPTFDSEVRRVVSADPDAVVLIGFLKDSATILRTMIERGVGPKDKNLYGAANMSNTLVRQVSPQDLSALAGMKGTNLRSIENEAFSLRLKQSDPSLQDHNFAAESYDSVIITALAAAVARTDAPGEVAKKINDVTRGGEKCASFVACKTLSEEGKDIDYDGASGPLEFTDTGDVGSGSYMIYEIQVDGSLKPIRVEEVHLN